MKAIHIIAAGLALGLSLGTAAMATGQKDCGGGVHVDYSKPCPSNDGGSSSNSSSSSSSSSSSTSTGIGVGVGVGIGQGGAASSGASATVKFGDTYAPPAPSGGGDFWCYTLPSGGICVPLKIVMIEKRVAMIDNCLAKRADKVAYVACIASIDDLPQIKRALMQAGVYGSK